MKGRGVEMSVSRSSLPQARGGQERYRTTSRKRRMSLAGFRRDEDGSIIMFSLFLFILMILIGGMAVDLMRFETRRVHV